tara:strand:+ start:985 stop:3981 length:2997 start_codon:yes stop_codon:yes gene_type:complete
MSLVWSNPAGSNVNVEQTATLTFKDNNVRAIYIDWDDGESNKTTESNYQWYQSTEPVSSTTLTHTYNKAGQFYPVVQVINSNGITSRYYSGLASEPDVKPHTEQADINNLIIRDTTPTGIMRVENTTVVTGIDNSIMEVEGPKKLYLAIAPTITYAELQTVASVTVDIEAVIHRNKFNARTGDETELALGTDISQEIFSVPVNLSTLSGSVYDFMATLESSQNGAFSKVLSFKFKNPKPTGLARDYNNNDIYNRLKIFLVTKAADGKYYPVSYVSAGSPLKKVMDSSRQLSLDMSQSRAAASNILISGASAYRYDTGKGWFNPVNQWTLSTSNFGTNTAQSTSLKQVHYTYLTNINGLNTNSTNVIFGAGATYTWFISGTSNGNIRQDLFALDDYGRVYDQYHTVRTSVLAAAQSAPVYAGSGSSILTNQPEVLLVRPTPDWTSPATPTETSVATYTDAMEKNGSTESFMLTGVNTTLITDVVGDVVTSQEKEFILLAFDSPTNNVFFNVTNYANGLISDLSSFVNTDGLKIAGVEYLHIDDASTMKQNAYWKPVEFTNTTNIRREVRNTTDKKYNNFHTSFAKSGYVSFDMPNDWAAASFQQLCGGVYNTASGSYAACTASGSDDINIQMTAIANVAGGSDGYGDKVVLTLDTTSKTAMEALTENDVGRFKYVFIQNDALTASGSAFWIASGASNGYVASTGKMTIQVGTTGSTPSFNTDYKIPVDSTISGMVRRVNIYDVVGGASKVFNDADVVADADNCQLITVGGENYNAGTSWFKNTYNVGHATWTGSTLGTNSKYLLKLTLSGATGAGGVTTAAPEIWNVFDANQGHSTIVKEIDDSAYNLNSLAITSDISVKRSGIYYQAITRKGKTFITKTGLGLENIGFSSVALGDENSTTAFADHGPSSLYGHLHMIRKIEADAVPVFWDEIQKDGTYVRFWGMVNSVSDTQGTGGPRTTTKYTFNMIVKHIALLKNDGFLMTDIFPLGGIENDRSYS